MKVNKLKNILENSSLTLILSYFIIHNISLVLIGIVISLYLINIEFFNSVIRYFNEKWVRKKLNREWIINDKTIKTDSIQIKSNKEDYKLNLVETIEVLGYIPSSENQDENKVA